MQVQINATTMGFSVPVTKSGMIKGTAISVVPYSQKFEHQQYDRADRRWYLMNEYYYHDSINERCFFPRFDLDLFCSYLQSNNISYEITELPGEEGRHTNFYMLPHIGYKSEVQKDCVDFLVSPTSGPIRGVGLQTGHGKTIAFIMAIQKIHRRAMITMTSRLEQWAKEVHSVTTLEEEDIYVIKGVGSLTKLFNQIDDGLKPKLILASSKTIRNYIDYPENYRHLPHPTGAMEKLGVGILGTDEYHEHFYTNFLMGLIFNPALFVPITATFTANDPYVKDIFDRFIPKNVQFSGGEYKRYTNITSYTYASGGHLIKPYHYRSPQGYSQQMFEKYLMSSKGKAFLDPLVHTAIIPIIKEHYINIAEKGEKFLFLCSSVKLCEYLEGVLRRKFPDKTVATFVSGRPVTILEKTDMILSTPGSAGCLTGDTLVSISRNNSDSNSGSYTCTLKNAYLHFNNMAKRPQYNWDREVPTYIRSYNGTAIQLGEVGDILYSGVKGVYRLILVNGFSLKCTADHPIMTTQGWVEAKDILGKDVLCEVSRLPVKGSGRKRLRDKYLYVPKHHPFVKESVRQYRGKRCVQRRIEIHRAIYEAVVLNDMTLQEYQQALKNPILVESMKFVDPSVYDIHHIDHNHKNNDPSNLVHLEKLEHKRLHAIKTKFNFSQGIPVYSKAASLEYLGEEDTYDIHCLDDSHNFVANGIVVHNTGRDIKNLRTCFAFENTNSESRNLQFLGRLRDFPAVKNTPEFVTLAFSCIEQTLRYLNTRAILYAPRGLTFKQRTIR